MQKIIHLDEYFATGEATVQPVLLWANNRACYENITKHASVGNEYFKTIQPVPGHSFVYVLAVSDWEHYAENRNGDGFPNAPYKPMASPPWISQAETLSNWHHTFESGNNFRHHCFTGETPILMGDRTRKPIEDVVAGDTVMTLEGAKKVVDVMKREYAGDGLSIRLHGNYTRIDCTTDHPVLVYRRDQVHCLHGYLRLGGIVCKKVSCRDLTTDIGEPKWIPASEIMVGDYAVFPKPELGTKKVPEAFARLIGWVASDGCLGKHGDIQFTFSSENTFKIDAVTQCLKDNGLDTGMYPSKLYERVLLSITKKEVADELAKYVTGKKAEKRLTPEVFKLDAESVLHVLGAFCDGDGHVARTNRNLGQLRIRSASESMLYVLHDLIRALGIPATVQWDGFAHDFESPLEGYGTYHSEGSGVVAVSKGYAAEVLVNSDRHKNLPEPGRKNTIRISGSHFLVPVTDVEEITLDTEVFNLEVEDVHHYVANGIVVHNCNKDPEKRVGKVVKSFWNDTMHRVELLIDLDNEKAPDLAARIAAGEFPPVSMGTKVSWDVCSVCGNRAPTRAQYCDHLRFQMRGVINGVKVAALNPSPKFFDISWVVRPADPTAYMMKKVANGVPYELISGVKAGEYLDLMDERKLAAHKIAVIDKVVQGISLDAKTENVDPTELGNIQRMRSQVLDMGGNVPVIPDETLHHLSSFPLEKTLSSAFSGGMLLKTPELTKLVFFKSYPKHHPEESWIDKSVGLQGPIMELISEHPQILDSFENADIFNVNKDSVDPKILEVLSPYFEKTSGMGDYLKRNIVPEKYRDEGEFTTPLTITDPATGQQYRTTRGAAIRAHDEVAKRNLYKTVGGAALLGGTYKVLGSGLSSKGLGALKPLVGGTLAAAGLSHLPSMGNHYMTDQGVPISTVTELSKTSSLALPLFGTLGLMTLLSSDYKSRMARGEPVGHPGLPLGRRLLDQAGEFTNEHPIASAAVGMAGLHTLGNSLAGRAANKQIIEPGAKYLRQGSEAAGNWLKRMADGTTKLSAMLDDLLPQPTDTVMLPSLDIEKIAERIGELIVEG
jgi:intein/homing endonuclease